jgi:hypothetical protein
MDTPIDPVEKLVPYVPADRVDHLHRNDRDKQRKSARSFQDELEDKERGTDPDGDEVVIESTEAADQDHSEESEHEPPEPPEPKPNRETSDHIDVKA